ncbi:glycosyl transferase family 92 [Rhodovulum bhavnagarense]|uniref:Glycosyl transferase family 92 n=1 Tax=Rhodovulum bhavnagarense TaxID=992286 RepID=A0A4R2RQ00_9RHOB|nr:glycosyltransferase family 92 protein [Rhodovulum bhavnagarense]TCP61911.1 glycosyl transferase family 92 [Rhodovulum bhavnagarense]
MPSLFSRKPITKLAFRPPAPEPGRDGVALVLIVRNEERHIAEWASFHRAAGATHVFVYDNGCTDTTLPCLREVLGDCLTVLPWNQRLADASTGREIHNQVLAYAHAMRNFGGAFRWMACIDADEFLVPKRTESIGAALSHLGDIPSVTLPWHNFGRNAHRVPPEGGVIANYTRRAADPMSGARGVTNFKTVVDATRVSAVRVHSVDIDGKAVTWNDRGERSDLKGRSARRFYSAEHLQLNHYYTRSEAELAAKIARGSNQRVAAERHAARVRRNVANIEAAEIEDRAAIDFLARLETTDSARL